MKRLALMTWMVAVLLAAPPSRVAATSTKAANDAAAWRAVDPADLLLIDTRYGEIAVELAPQFAPHHVARVRALARARFYDGLSFYRVIDGFVAQGGIGEDADAAKYHPRRAKALGQWPPLKAEFDLPIADIPDAFTPTGTPDLFAPEVGYVDGFPVGRDPKEGREWLLHCPGTFAFARDNGADTASTEFYIVIGEAPRRLDRNLTAVGRVIAGMRYVQKLNRGEPDVDAGVIQNVTQRDPILRVRLAADLPAKDRPHYQVMRTDTPAFAAWMAARIDPAPGFYVRQPPKVLDVCLAPVPARRVTDK